VTWQSIGFINNQQTMDCLALLAVTLKREASEKTEAFLLY